MASCDWQKIKSAGEAKAMLRHSAQDERAKVEHSNKDIDVSLSHRNATYGALSSYREACEAYDERIAALDSVPGANRRKDRVTMIGLVIPAPEGMDEDTARKWFDEAYQIASDEVGRDNVIGGSAHFDEIHDYRDSETKEMRTSRAHLHVYAIPERGGKLNAKAVTGRAAMVRMNNRIEAMTEERYPGYKFLDGSKRKSRKSVEALKQESDAAEAVAQAQKEAEEIRKQANSEKEALEALRTHLEADRAHLDAERQIFQSERSEWHKKAYKELEDTIRKEREDADAVKQMYQLAYDDAKGISQGFALEAFYRAFAGALRDEMKKVRFPSGKTGWDAWGRYANTALERAKTDVAAATPQRQYKERVADRVARADRLSRRPLPSLPDDWEYGDGEKER